MDAVAKVKKGFLTYDSRRDKVSVSWTETLSLVPNEILLRQLEGLKSRAKGRMLDVGCGAKPYSLVFSPLVDEYLGIDLPTSDYGIDEIDVYASALTLPFKSNSFDTVLCTEVLEHVPDPQGLIHELSRVLKTDGSLLLSTPQNYWVHSAPNDYYRFTKFGLSYLIERDGFEIIDITSIGGASSCTVDFVSKLSILGVGALDALLGRLVRRPGTNLAAFLPVRLFIALPQWAFLVAYFKTGALVRRYKWLGFLRQLLEKNAERFTLGHIVVAVKR